MRMLPRVPRTILTGSLIFAAVACTPAAPDGAADQAEPAPSPVAQAPAPAPAIATVTLAPAALSVVRSAGAGGSELAFGTPMAVVIDQLTAALGQPTERGHSPECGPGPLDYAQWPGNLTTYFNGGNFSGWTLSSRGALPAGMQPLASAAGIGIGSTRAAAEAAFRVEYFEDSLGPELMGDGLSVQLDGAAPSARITGIMAGDDCAAR